MLGRGSAVVRWKTWRDLVAEVAFRITDLIDYG